MTVNISKTFFDIKCELICINPYYKRHSFNASYYEWLEPLYPLLFFFFFQVSQFVLNDHTLFSLFTKLSSTPEFIALCDKYSEKHVNKERNFDVSDKKNNQKMNLLPRNLVVISNPPHLSLSLSLSHLLIATVLVTIPINLEYQRQFLFHISLD